MNKHILSLLTLLLLSIGVYAQTPPVVGDIPDETISEGGSFATISLDGYVADFESADADIVWTYSTLTNLTVSIDVNRIATIGVVDGDWNGTESITFIATDPGSLTDNDAATFIVTAMPL